jgi:ubiquinone/menaquinone biosynthesis C-methylase UbiE
VLSLIDFVANTVVSGLGVAAGLQTTLRATQNLHPYPLPHQLAGVLDLPLRRQYLDPGEVLGMYGVGAGMTILEAGCGTGIFTVQIARMVGDLGQVHAVDLQEPMLTRTRMRVHGAGVSNLVHLHHCGLYDVPLPDDSIDLAVMVSTLGEIPDKPAALSELRRLLKPGGRLGITDELLFPAHVLARSARRWAEDAGFRIIARSGSPICYHIVLANEK